MDTALLNEAFFIVLAKKGHKVYILLPEMAVLAFYDLHLEEWQIVCTLPPCYRAQQRAFVQFYVVAGKLYLFSQEGARLFIYDTDTDAYEEAAVFLDQAAAVVAYENTLAFLPFGKNGLVCFDTVKKEIAVHTGWETELVESIKKKGSGFKRFKRNSACIVNNDIYSVAECSNRQIIFSICLDTMKLNGVYEIHRKGKLFILEPEGESIWLQCLTCAGSRFIRWNCSNIKSSANVVKQENGGGRAEEETEVFPEATRRALSFKQINGLLIINFVDGGMLVLNRQSLKVERRVKNIFLHTVQEDELILSRGFVLDFFTGNDTINGQASKKILLPENFILQCYLEFLNKQERIGDVSESRIGVSIFHTLCGRKGQGGSNRC